MTGHTGGVHMDVRPDTKLPSELNYRLDLSAIGLHMHVNVYDVDITLVRWTAMCAHAGDE